MNVSLSYDLSMKKNKIILISLTIIIIGGIYLVYQKSYKERKESLFCPTTVDSTGNMSPCYAYRCDTGYIFTNRNKIAPGNNPLECSDGSKIKQVGEVDVKDRKSWKN